MTITRQNELNRLRNEAKALKDMQKAARKFGKKVEKVRKDFRSTATRRRPTTSARSGNRFLTSSKCQTSDFTHQKKGQTMNLSFLNPVNWIKSGVAAKADAEIDRLLTSKNLECCGRNGVNYLIQLSESKVDDDKLEQIANDLIYAGESLVDLGRSIHPQGENGRKLSEGEVAALNARVKVLFGDVLHEWDLANIREQAKALVRKILGI